MISAGDLWDRLPVSDTQQALSMLGARKATQKSISGKENNPWEERRGGDRGENNWKGWCETRAYESTSKSLQETWNWKMTVRCKERPSCLVSTSSTFPMSFLKTPHVVVGFGGVRRGRGDKQGLVHHVKDWGFYC